MGYIWLFGREKTGLGDMEQVNNGRESGEALEQSEASVLARVTPLARQINCLDIKRIASVCVENIPLLTGARFASLYVLDESNNILHLQKCNHPFLINKIVSLNQNPPGPMILAVKSKE